LKKKEALALYYRLTAFIREHDATGFGRFMAFKDGAFLKDEVLMDLVLSIMVARHQAALEQFMPTAKGTGT